MHESLFSPNAESLGILMGIRGEFVAGPSGIARNQLGLDFQQLECLFPHLGNAENEIQRLGSLFSTNADSVRTQMVNRGRCVAAVWNR